MVKSVLSLCCSFFVVLVGMAHAYAEDGSSADAPKATVHRHRVVVRHHAAPAHKVAYAPRQRAAVVRAAYAPSSVGDMEGLNHTRDALSLQSNVALVLDQSSSQVLFDKNSEVALPIASITKMMTALVVVEAKQDMNEILEITEEDVDHEKNSSSRLRPGVRMTRGNMLHIALMSSENRAAHALGRNYPGGLQAAVAAMNAKAHELGMNDTHYVEPTGLSSQNVASARDLARLVAAASKEPLLCQYSTDTKYMVEAGGRPLQYANTNHLVSNPTWDIMLQKTGYIIEAGHCLLMRAMIEGRAVVMVFLDAKGKYSGMADAGRIRKWLETDKPTAANHFGVVRQS
ncbi:MAG: D-alanyl-D-alanine endopeptidase [Burkholderiaceae bacterium]|nr:D-alanyl-D-alanine endopeptidase [Burkholderiaceae bacterium]